MILYKSTSRKIFEVLNYLFFVLVSASIMIPFLNSISISLSGPIAARTGKVGLWPVEFNLNAYGMIIFNGLFIRSFMNTIFLTLMNTFLVIFISLCAGYALANKDMLGRKAALIFVLIPMYFSGGLIPFYILVNNLGLTDSYLALILPSVVNIFYIIVFRNSIAQIPHELRESAEIDGASEFIILFRIIMPVIIPMVMAFIIFSAISYWNEWFGVLLFIRNKLKWTLQFKLREILTSADMMDGAEGGSNNILHVKVNALDVHPLNLRMAALMVSVLPIIIVYPFLQKYFIHGIIVGAVKG